MRRARHGWLIVVAVVGLPFAIGTTQGQEVGVDRPGHDLKPGFDLPAADPALCLKACEEDPACKAYTYVKPGIQGSSARCWLKSDVQAAVANDCCISGVRELATLRAAPVSWTTETGTDRPGADLTSFDLPQPDSALCQTACEKEAACKAYTYVKPGFQGSSARCWLKSAVPAAVASDCCISGVRVVARPAATEPPALTPIQLPAPRD